MKNLFLHLYIHQAITTEEKYFREVVESLYIPVLRTIKNSKNLILSISITLSTLELLDKYNYKNLLQEIKDLIHQEKITLASCPAYNTRLGISNEEFVINQIILNEYALGYYFGMRNGFEGESAILIKDISTCFYPGNDLTPEFLKELHEIGYPSILMNRGFYTLSPDANKENKVNGLQIPAELGDSIYDKILNSSLDINSLLASLEPNTFVSLPIDVLFTLDHDFSYKFTKFVDTIMSLGVDFKNSNELLEDSDTLLPYFSIEELLTNNHSKLGNSMIMSADKVIKDPSTLRELLLTLASNFILKAPLNAVDNTNSLPENIPLWLDKYTNADPLLRLNVITNKYSDLNVWLKSAREKHEFDLGPLIEIVQELGKTDLVSKIEKLSE